MKKTRDIKLVLITAALASCHHPEPEWRSAGNVYIRADSTAPFTLMAHPHPGAPLVFYRFRPYGYAWFGGYRRVGYYSNAFNEEVNIGRSAEKSGVIRGGFGGSAFSVES